MELSVLPEKDSREEKITFSPLDLGKSLRFLI